MTDQPYRVLRYEVPVDDQWHRVDLSGAVLHVDTRRHEVVEFWALDGGDYRTARYFRVFGTGQPLPYEQLRTSPGQTGHVGSVVAANGQLVWHLFEGYPPEGAP